MKVCIPTLDSNGVQSRVSPHFGRAPQYLVIDTNTQASDMLNKPEGDH